MDAGLHLITQAPNVSRVIGRGFTPQSVPNAGLVSAYRTGVFSKPLNGVGLSTYSSPSAMCPAITGVQLVVSGAAGEEGARQCRSALLHPRLSLKVSVFDGVDER